MSLSALFSDLSAHLASPEFLLTARHREHPTAFTRTRKLPLPSLIALLLCGMRMSIQAELDQFFAHLRQQAQLVRNVSAQAFSQARAKLSVTAIPQLNAWLIERAQHHGFVPLWRGLRLVAADASTVRFGVRASHVKRPALADQIAFGLFLPTAELMLAPTLYSLRDNNERQMLFEHLDLLSSGDLLLMDRGYPCCWLVSVFEPAQDTGLRARREIRQWRQHLRARLPAQRIDGADCCVACAQSPRCQRLCVPA